MRRADRVHVGLGLLERDAGLQSRERHEPVKVARHVGRFERERPPELVECAVEGAPGRQHADHRVGLVVEQNRAIDDRGVRPELVHPEHMTQDHDVILPELVFIGQERAASFCLDAVDVKKMRRDTCAPDLDRVSDAGERGRSARLSGHGVEDGVVPLPVEEVQGRDAVAVAARRFFEDADDPVGIPIGQRPEQNAIDETENRGVRADAQCERENRDGGESRTPGQGSPAVARVLQQ